MYAPYFGLKHEPFSIAPDPRYLFMSERHREALAHLLYGVDGGGGFVLLSGEIGAGKTTVCRCFLEQIPANTNVAYIFNPKLTVVELLQSICEEFGVTPRAHGVHGRTTIKDYLDPLNAFLLESHAAGRNNVLIIDEAQMLSGSVLEQLRLLTNLETNERKLLQIILIGQPELRELLAKPELEQLAQRVIARYHLDALTLEDTERYVRHRLAVAGMTAATPFDARAIRRIHQLSRGVPRRINLLCDRALLGAYAAGRTTVDRAIIDKAAGEVFGSDRGATGGGRGGKSGRSRRRSGASGDRSVWASAALGGAVVAALALLATAWTGWRGGVSGGAASALQTASRPAAAMDAARASSDAARATSTARVGSANPAAAASGSPRIVEAEAQGAAWAGSQSAEDAASRSAASAAPQAAAPAPTYLTAADLRARFATLTRDERDAWRALAPAWNLALAADADPCTAAQRSDIQCYRNASSTLAQIRQLDRPGILALRDENDKPIYAVLTGLGDRTATLRIGGTSQTLALISLATLWRGDFATFWRAPSGWTGRPIDAGSGPAAAWLGRRIAGLRGQPAPANETEWRAQLAAFQLAQGLKADAIAGPTTFMQLNRAIGVDEPRLRSGGASGELRPHAAAAAVTGAPSTGAAGAILAAATAPAGPAAARYP